MKITFRLIISLVLVAALVAGISSYVQVQSDRERMNTELDARAAVLGESMLESVSDLLIKDSVSRLKRFVEKFENRENMVGVTVFDTTGAKVVSGPALDALSAKPPVQVWNAMRRSEPVSGIEMMGGRMMHVYAVPVTGEGTTLGVLLLVHDASYIEARLEGIWNRNFVRLLVQSLLIILTTVIVVRWSLTGPIARIADWMRGLRLGTAGRLDTSVRGDILGPLATEVTLLAKSLAAARASAETEARLRIEGESVWTAERLKEHVRRELGGKNLYVVSNREPYMHVKQGNVVECIVPAGGLVTALDPILRACGGTWLAHGGGDADKENADERGRLAVPPTEPSYTLRRVFLSKEEEEGYYYGFSNEGIWPLCHITHTRPAFRLDDWVQYQRANEHFADALLDEIRDEEEPLILIQDYHFCLLPLLIKAQRPDARIALFWHIPWPNPEVFGICPWKQEILVGLLGADLLGFHIQFHCNNFLETVDRYLESRVNWDQFSVERRGLKTLVRPFPISVAFTGLSDESIDQPGRLREDKEGVFKKTGMVAEILALGVDRIDYTKGIVERFRAVERLLEKNPEYIGRFTFVELGAPSRTHIKRYHDLMSELDEVTERINWRFRSKNWRPIVFLKAHHNHDTVRRFYRIADICAVTSLHDGMNLVAKEFVSSRDDEDGVLILSQFTGASRELADALIVNPYDIEELADTFHRAITMSHAERHERMQRLRTNVKDRNVYRWAANIVTALTHMRVPPGVEEKKG
jgi:trehalose-6-phosphate synthase